MKKFILVVALFMMAGCATQNTTKNVKYWWSEPKIGSKIVKYNVQHRISSKNWVTIGSTDTNEITIPCLTDKINYVRVCGVDSNGDIGVYSDPSDGYTPK